MSVNYVDKTTGELVTLANGTRMWIGTKSAHDLAVQQGTMPNNCMVCITDDAAGEEAWEYSTSETNTGKKWIDDKPIYRKVVNFGALPNATNKTSPIDIDNIDNFTSLYGIAQDSSTALHLPHVGSDTAGRITLAVLNKATISITTGSDRRGFTAYIILEYTKTTD